MVDTGMKEGKYGNERGPKKEKKVLKSHGPKM